MPVFRGGSVVEFDGNCEDGNCEDEGCRSSFDVDVGCDGRGADWLDDGSDVLAEGVVGLRYPPAAELLLRSLSNESKSYVEVSPP